ncbi:MAG TPA: succinate dehydrogenase, cytochrome b subunit [Hyphomicrobiaceae bacterium]|jgi:fumarate reductase subunit D|nr:succinate dehydrogenase, cytochrome b subunit [Hyphomicrobiaceae bacterium]
MNGNRGQPQHAPNTSGHRHNTLWLAALLHRLSGLALAAFLPLHFLVFALVLKSEAALDGLLRWTANPAVKLAETGLVFLLTLHLLGGIRILLLENLPWFAGHKRLVAGALLTASMLALIFLVRAA